MEDLESHGKFALQISNILQPYKNSAIVGISVMAPILKFLVFELVQEEL
jgi:hypothetical protein